LGENHAGGGLGYYKLAHHLTQAASCLRIPLRVMRLTLKQTAFVLMASANFIFFLWQGFFITGLRMGSYGTIFNNINWGYFWSKFKVLGFRNS
jgi:hypothetical protein